MQQNEGKQVSGEGLPGGKMVKDNERREKEKTGSEEER